MKDLAIGVRCEDKAMNDGFSNEESVKFIAEAGFKKVFMSFQNEHLSGGGYRKFLKLIKDNNLEVSFVHLGYRVNDGIATLWEEGEAGDELIKDYMKDLDIVASDGIKLVCMHVTKSNRQSPMSEIGIARMKKLIKHAENLGVMVALENTVWEGYIEFICDHIKSPNLKVCLDSGHNHFHFKDSFNFDRFKNMIACVHLHDNDGTADQHLLPFDGNIDWNKLIWDLKESGYQGDITSESVYKGQYKDISPLNFYIEAKNRLAQIAQTLEKLEKSDGYLTIK